MGAQVISGQVMLAVQPFLSAACTPGSVRLLHRDQLVPQGQSKIAGCVPGPTCSSPHRPAVHLQRALCWHGSRPAIWGQGTLPCSAPQDQPLPGDLSGLQLLHELQGQHTVCRPRQVQGVVECHRASRLGRDFLGCRCCLGLACSCLACKCHTSVSMQVGLAHIAAKGILSLPTAVLPSAAHSSLSTDAIATCIYHCMPDACTGSRGTVLSMLRCIGTLQEAVPAGLAAAVLRLLPPLAVLFIGELAAAGSGGGSFTGGSTKPASSMLRLESVQDGDAAPCRSLMAPCTDG